MAEFTKVQCLYECRSHTYNITVNKELRPDVLHASNPGTWEAKAGRSLEFSGLCNMGSRLTRAVQRDLDQRNKREDITEF